MILSVKIEIEKSKENYQAVVNALSEFDVSSVAWEDESTTEVKVDPSVRMDRNIDIAASVSQAIDRSRRRHNI